MPTLSIIIPVYNQARMTEQILKDIPTKMKSDYEVIIVDNGSDNETKELLKNHKDIVLITYPKNRYVTEAWNSGIAIARGEYIMVCNNDITFCE
jgi:glycosyltransferase involved in cell wall biosynthesis